MSNGADGATLGSAYISGGTLTTSTGDVLELRLSADGNSASINGSPLNSGFDNVHVGSYSNTIKDGGFMVRDDLTIDSWEIGDI